MYKEPHENLKRIRQFCSHHKASTCRELLCVIVTWGYHLKPGGSAPRVTRVCWWRRDIGKGLQAIGAFPSIFLSSWLLYIPTMTYLWVLNWLPQSCELSISWSSLVVSCSCGNEYCGLPEAVQTELCPAKLRTDYIARSGVVGPFGVLWHRGRWLLRELGQIGL